MAPKQPIGSRSGGQRASVSGNRRAQTNRWETSKAALPQTLPIGCQSQSPSIVDNCKPQSPQRDPIQNVMHVAYSYRRTANTLPSSAPRKTGGLGNERRHGPGTIRDIRTFPARSLATFSGSAPLAAGSDSESRTKLRDYEANHTISWRRVVDAPWKGGQRDALVEE